MISSRTKTIINDDKIRNVNFIVTVVLFELEKRDLGSILTREELLEALEEWNLEYCIVR